MKQLMFLTAMVAFVAPAMADTIRGIDIDFVTIGNPGNAADTQVMTTDGTTGYGSVDYTYRIGKYEVTATQWQTINTAAGIGGSGYWSGNQPVTYISWYDVAQFCNYLTSGDKSKGAYLFSGNNTNPGNFLGINRTAAISSYGTAYVIPTEDEWYKAAYFKPDGSGYSFYTNGLDTIPAADNGWNYYDGSYSIPWEVDVGLQEQNGTFNMMGNVWEWNETLKADSSRGLRGGSYNTSLYHNYNHYPLSSSYRSSGDSPFGVNIELGFRVASIPEPCTLLLLGVGGMLIRKR